MTPDHLRKAAVGMEFVADLEAGEAEQGRANVSTDGTAKEGVAYDGTSVYGDKQKLRDLRREINSYMRSDARRQELADAIVEAARQMPKLERPPVSPTVYTDRTENRELVLGIGDMHYGAEFNIKGLRGDDVLNAYNREIFEKRMDSLLDQAAAIVMHEEVSVVHLCFVGDMIDGMIHKNQLTKLEYGVIDQTMYLAEYLAEWINSLSEYAYVVVHAVNGNHSEVRPLGAKSREFEDENLERIILWYLKSRLQDNELVSVEGKGERREYFSVFDYHFMLLHGDGAFGKKISDIARDSVNLYGVPVDFFLCGHLHKAEEFNAGVTRDGNSVILRVPSICGMNDYALAGEMGGEPGAIALVMEREYGRRCTYPIRLK